MLGGLNALADLKSFARKAIQANAQSCNPGGRASVGVVDGGA